MCRPFVATLVLLLAAAPLPARAAAPAEWVIASIAPDGSPSEQYIRWVGRRIEEVTHRRVRVRHKGAALLGDEQSTLDLLQQGRVQLWAGSLSAVTAALPALSVLDAPYLFADLPAFERAIDHRLFQGPLLRRALAAQNVVWLGIAFVGWRAFSATRAVRLPEDLRGARGRALPSPTNLMLWRRVGAIPVPLQMTEVTEAVQAGRVDASDLPLQFLYATSLVGALRHHTRTNHVMQLALLLVNEDALRALAPHDRRAIEQLRPELSFEANRVHAKLEAELLTAIAADGVKVHEPSRAEMDAWRAALQPLQQDAARLAGREGAELLSLLRARRR